MAGREAPPAHHIEFKVASRTDIKKLAVAIATNLRHGKRVNLITIGHGSIGQALKAVPLVNQECILRGFYYAVVPSFETRLVKFTANDGTKTEEERTVMCLRFVEIRT